MFVVKTDTLGFTLANKRWLEKFWKPVNSRGYRDIEHVSEKADEDNIIFVIGDSFVAGYGVKHVKDRFSNILQHELGKNYRVLNIAKNGWDTMHEYQALISYPLRPTHVILGYYINDVKPAAYLNGLNFPENFPEPSKSSKFFMKHSYFINFVFWRINGMLYTRSEDSYWDYILECFNNEDVWSYHRNELMQIIQFCKQKDIKLDVIVFPYLANTEKTKIPVKKVVGLFRENNVDVIDIGKLIQEKKTVEIIVNNRDPHPNENLNRIIAKHLLTIMTLRKIVDYEKKCAGNDQE